MRRRYPLPLQVIATSTCMAFPAGQQVSVFNIGTQTGDRLHRHRAGDNVGPMAVEAITALETLGVRTADAVTRLPAQVTTDDLERADRGVALKQAEHLPLLQERFPAWAEKVEFWQVDDAPEALGLIEREVMGLVARILGEGERQDSKPTEAPVPQQAAPKEPATKPATVKVGRGNHTVLLAGAERPLDGSGTPTNKDRETLLSASSSVT